MLRFLLREGQGGHLLHRHDVGQLDEGAALVGHEPLSKVRLLVFYRTENGAALGNGKAELVPVSSTPSSDAAAGARTGRTSRTDDVCRLLVDSHDLPFDMHVGLRRVWFLNMSSRKKRECQVESCRWQAPSRLVSACRT